jgi:lysophospholipase L1-like esterase
LHDKTIESKFGDYYWVYNLGIPGETSADVLSRFEPERLARKPNVVIIAFGTNDSARPQAGGASRVAIDQFKDNISRMVNAGLRVGARVFVVGAGVVDEALTSPFDGHSFFSQAELDKYSDELENFAKSADAVFIPIRDILDKSDLIDGLHPNNSGHEKIFERVRRVLTEQGVIE